MLGSGARAWFRAQVLGSGPRCSVRGPGAGFRAQVLSSGPRCSVQGSVLGSGPRARFRAQVLGSGPRCSVQGPGAWASTSGSTGEHCQALYLTRAALGYYRLKVYKKFFLLNLLLTTTYY